jgi:uncharacterized protein YndB with AHSA1/START domain
MFEQQPANAARIGHWVDLRRHLAAPRQVVFRQWIEPHELATWFGPVGFTVAAHLIVPEIGGGWRMTLRSPLGEDFVVAGRFLEIEPPRRLRFSWRPESGVRPSHPTEVEVAFCASEGSTRLHLRHGPFASPEQAVRHTCAWERALDSLALRLDEEWR